jgi:nitrate reductase gamma subunit
MLSRLLRIVLIPPLLIAVTVLVIIGLKDFNLLVAIVGKLIVATVIIGIPVLIMRRIIFPK